MAPEHDEVSINALSLPRTECGIIGSWYGGARPWVDLPKIADLYLSGRLQIDPMISRTYPLRTSILHTMHWRQAKSPGALFSLSSHFPLTK